MQWHWLDLCILGVIALSVITGLFRGFVKELIALCVWVIGIWLAFNYSRLVDPYLQKYIQDQTARSVAGFVIILLGILLLGGLINALLSFILKRTGLSGTDRFLGMGFGLVRGVFIVALLMLMVSLTSMPVNEYRHDSKLYAHFDPMVTWLYTMMPDFIKKIKMVDTQDHLADINPEF